MTHHLYYHPLRLCSLSAFCLVTLSLLDTRLDGSEDKQRGKAKAGVPSSQTLAALVSSGFSKILFTIFKSWYIFTFIGFIILFIRSYVLVFILRATSTRSFL